MIKEIYNRYVMKISSPLINAIVLLIASCIISYRLYILDKNQQTLYKNIKHVREFSWKIDSLQAEGLIIVDRRLDKLDSLIKK